MIIKNRTVKSLFKTTIFRFFSFINKLIPKDQQRILLYSNFGFRDNLKALYNMLIKGGYNIRYQVICSLDSYVRYKGEEPVNVRFVSNVRGLLAFFRAGHVFYCFGKYPIKPSKSQKVIHLWHGTPLKRIGNMIEDEKEDQFYFTYVLAASELFRPIMCEAFTCPPENVVICGHARNDCLFSNLDLPSFLSKKKYDKIIFWLPTYRKSSVLKSDGNTILPLFNEQALIDLDKKLASTNTGMIVKFHPAQDMSTFYVPTLTNIHIFTHRNFMKEGLELYSLLAHMDALITDYSSIYFDYLLLNRPIAFTIDDFGRYEKSRGFVFANPYEFMPGTKISTVTEFLEFLDGFLAGKDLYEEDRKRVNDLVNFYKDDKNCDRILQLAGIFL